MITNKEKLYVYEIRCDATTNLFTERPNMRERNGFKGCHNNCNTVQASFNGRVSQTLEN